MSFFSQFFHKDEPKSEGQIQFASSPEAPAAASMQLATAPEEHTATATMARPAVGRITLPPHFELEDLFEAIAQYKASDLHLSVGRPPTLRIDGVLVPADGAPLSQAHAERILLPVLTEDQRKRLEEKGSLDTALASSRTGHRFRANYYRQVRGMGCALRVIPSRVPTLEELGAPAVLKKLADLRAGLVVVTGPTGSGKSTTLAAMVDHINRTRAAHIITIEDPIEFCHEGQECLIDHREIGEHATHFADAVRAALRESPDILLVGEMRDLETIYQAVKAAETGSLVLATLHTSSAAKTIDRIMGVFPPNQQDQIRSMLAECLKGVVAQQLLRRKSGEGRVGAYEVLVGTPALSNLIRKGETAQVMGLIEQGRSEGMQSMDRALMELVRNGIISRQTAIERAHDRSALGD